VWTCSLIITVCNAAGYDLDGRFSIPGRDIFLFHTFRPVQWLLEVLSSGLKRPEYETDHLAPSTVVERSFHVSSTASQGTGTTILLFV
jgi:hypothetical protein